MIVRVGGFIRRLSVHLQNDSWKTVIGDNSFSEIEEGEGSLWSVPVGLLNQCNG
jgi:hypothetical protein